ncbi:hypothetical protein V6N13_127387 [Hibiscus sabdariffa]
MSWQQVLETANSMRVLMLPLCNTTPTCKGSNWHFLGRLSLNLKDSIIPSPALNSSEFLGYKRSHSTITGQNASP